MSDKFLFVSRHKPNKGQEAIIKSLGFDNIKVVSHNFKDTLNPTPEFNEVIGDCQTVGLVGPTHLFINLLNQSSGKFKLVEFINQPSARERGKFLCKGAMIYQIKYDCLGVPRINSEFVDCPLSLEEQDEGDLNYNK